MENNAWDWKEQKIEKLAKEKLASLSQEEMKSIADQYKKTCTTILVVILALAFIGITIMALVTLLEPSEEPTPAALIVCPVYGILVIFLVVGILSIRKKSIEELALLGLKKEIKESFAEIIQKEKELEQSENWERITKGKFVVSKSINIVINGKIFSKLLIDNEHKLFIHQRDIDFTKMYRFSDLINYEVYENGQSMVKGRAGSALIGGAFFGLTGLIVGSSRSRAIEEKCNQLKLLIRLNDLDHPQIVITYVDNIAYDKTGYVYRAMKENLQQVCSALEYIMNAKTLEQSAAVKEEKTIQVVEHYNVSDNQSLKEQLLELKEMLYSGLITEEEYETKRKEIFK